MKFNEAQVLLQSVHALISDLMQHQPTSQSLSYTHLYFDWIFIESLNPVQSGASVSAKSRVYVILIYILNLRFSIKEREIGGNKHSAK